jgi:hypothetical protein
MRQLSHSTEKSECSGKRNIGNCTQWRTWSEARPPDLHNIVVQLLNAASGTVKRDPFLARQEFERSLSPRPRETVEHLLVRIDRELSSLTLTLGIRIEDDELISRVMYNSLSAYPHLTDFLIPFKTGERRKPSTYSEFKAWITAYDTAKDPHGKSMPLISDRVVRDVAMKNKFADSKKTVETAASISAHSARASEETVNCQICGKCGHSAMQCKRFVELCGRNKDSKSYKSTPSKPKAHSNRRKEGVKLADADDGENNSAYVIGRNPKNLRHSVNCDEVIADSGLLKF